MRTTTGTMMVSMVSNNYTANKLYLERDKRTLVLIKYLLWIQTDKFQTAIYKCIVTFLVVAAAYLGFI